MQQIYYSIACIVYGIFIMQFILSWFGGDSEFDVDLDGDADLSINDISKALKLSISAVKKRLERARNILKEKETNNE